MDGVKADKADMEHGYSYSYSRWATLITVVDLLQVQEHGKAKIRNSE